MSAKREDPPALTRRDGGTCTWIPPWVREVGTAVWVTDPEARIVCFNARAEELLGKDAAECLGQLCWLVVAGRDPEGRPHCEARCKIRALAESRQEIRPLPLAIADRSGRVRSVEVLAVPVRAPDLSGPWLVHCALDRGRAERIECYLRRVASQPRAPERAIREARALTARETEILSLLAEAESQARIAERLCVSPVTVRNHVQHILDKLCVHSVAQAVACHLLTRGSS